MHERQDNTVKNFQNLRFMYIIKSYKYKISLTFLHSFQIRFAPNNANYCITEIIYCLSFFQYPSWRHHNTDKLQQLSSYCQKYSHECKQNFLRRGSQWPYGNTMAGVVKGAENMLLNPSYSSGFILGSGSPNERPCNIITPSLVGSALTQILNPRYAELFWIYRNMCLYFRSFFHILIAEVVEISFESQLLYNTKVKTWAGIITKGTPRQVPIFKSSRKTGDPHNTKISSCSYRVAHCH